MESSSRPKGKPLKRPKLLATLTGMIVGGIAILSILVVLPIVYPPADIAIHGDIVAYHHHAKIELYENGERITIPSDIGIVPGTPLAQYGPNGMSPVHTHAFDGTIHIESKVKDRIFTVGDFFNVWKGAGYADGKSVSINGQATDINTYPFQDGAVLKIEITG